MEQNNISLNSLKPGQSARIKTLECEGTIRRKLLDLGLVEDTVIEVIQKSPAGDPTAYFVRGAVIAIREEESSHIFVSEVK